MLENVFICYYTWFLFTINCWMVWLRVVFVWMHIYLANLKTLSLHLSASNLVVDLSGDYHVLHSVIHTLISLCKHWLHRLTSTALKFHRHLCWNRHFPSYWAKIFPGAGIIASSLLYILHLKLWFPMYSICWINLITLIFLCVHSSRIVSLYSAFCWCSSSISLHWHFHFNHFCFYFSMTMKSFS